MEGTLPAACAALVCAAAACTRSRRSSISADPDIQAATVAYVPNAKKKAFFAALCSALTKRGIRTQALTPGSNLAGTDDPPSLIVHKLTDDIALAADSAEAAARLAAVHAVTASNPSIIMLDPIPAIEKVRDRRKMAAAVQQLPATLPLPHVKTKHDAAREPLAAVTVRMPRTVEVLASDKAEAPPGFSSDWMLVVKSATACSTPESHYMAVVESWEQIASLHIVAKDHSVCPTFPVVVQPYIPHGGIVYKVYVVGSAPVRVGHHKDAARYYVVPKPSLRLTPQVKSSVPACPEPRNGNNKRLLLFDALHPSRTPAGSALFQQVQADDVDLADHTSSTEHLQAPPDWVIEALNKELQRVLELTFFGYDLVCEESTGEYWILDINYFPSYTGCEGVIDAVADTIESHLLASFERGNARPHEQ
eukprot:COSAG02_NODE_1802_length_10890_cov_10.379205_2_plen_421_part_00